MKTQKIIKALETFSPKGLCAETTKKSGSYGNKNNFVGCAMGCLASAYVVKNKLNPKNKVIQNGCKASGAEGFGCSDEEIAIADGIYNHFGLSAQMAENIVCLNDSVDHIDYNADESAKVYEVPRALARTIVRLRKKNMQIKNKAKTK